MLLPRILTALVGAPLVLAAVHFGGVFYTAFVAAVIIFCLYEYGLILLTGGKGVNRLSLIIFGALMLIAALAARAPVPAGLNLPDNLPGFFIALSLAGVFLLEILSPKRSLERVANTFLGVMLIPWALAHLISIRLIEPYGEYFTYILFISVWVNDIAAYFVGTKLGRHRLNKEVSPKKSWEGAVGGLIFGVAAAVLGAAIVILGQISDLAESLIKRSANVKDSSGALPGHGGFLDRFDAFLLCAPAVYYLILWMI
ncbi:MAG: phosphatidate cytidylyltransferase [Elusimicrobiota bacterium]|jgi:phosphatidate cytidylyltransferase|nr:phosphatidate cytidylyltransferase [Elusimicrobiota bacterium]